LSSYVFGSRRVCLQGIERRKEGRKEEGRKEEGRKEGEGRKGKEVRM
jgi:hypothetical protein